MHQSRAGVLQQGGLEMDEQVEEFLDAMDTGVSAMIELVQRGHTTPEQEVALYEYLKKNGVIQ